MPKVTIEAAHPQEVAEVGKMQCTPFPSPFFLTSPNQATETMLHCSAMKAHDSLSAPPAHSLVIKISPSRIPRV